MWSVGSKALDVYLGTRALVIGRGVELLHSAGVTEFEEALEALKAWLEAFTPGQKLRVWLSGALCRPFIVPAVDGVSTRDELNRVALALAPQQTGLVGACRVWVDVGPRGTPLAAVAVPQDVIDRLYATLAAAKGRRVVVSIRPWWSEVLRHVLAQRPATPAISVQDCDSLTFLVGSGGRFESVATYSPITDHETARSALARALLSADIGPGEEVRCRLEVQGVARGQVRAGVALAAVLESTQ